MLSRKVLNLLLLCYQVMDRLTEILVVNKFHRIPKELQEKFMALHDAHNIIPAGRAAECPVVVFGLESNRGKQLNGRRATVVTNARQANDRWMVTFSNCEANSTATYFSMAIKAKNLKTPGGIYRTNAFPDGVFEYRSRINHACNANTNSMEIEGTVAIVANRCIEEGEEITCNYINTSAGSADTSLSAVQRRDYLKGKYNFHCVCQFCESGM